MSQIVKKFIGTAQVSSVQVDSSIALTTDLANYILSSEKGANSGVATLDSGGKIPAAQLPNSVMEYKGNWNASTNSPTLSDGTGSAGDVYRVSVAGSQDLGSGSLSFSVGDWAVYNGTTWEKSLNSSAVVSVNGQTGIVTLVTTDIAEGTNLYFTTARAKTAAVVNSTAGTETDQAASVSAMKSYVSTQVAAVNRIPFKETKTLSGGDVTAQFVTLSHTPIANSILVWVDGVMQDESVDFTLSGAVVTFAGGLATGGASALIAGDKLRFFYMY